MMSMNGDNEMNWPEKRANTAETYLFGGNGLLAGLAKLFNSLGVIAQILLASDEDDGKALAEVHDLGNPLQDTHANMDDVSDAFKHNGRNSERTFSCTLSRESGESTAKQMRMTWESG